MRSSLVSGCIFKLYGKLMKNALFEKVAQKMHKEGWSFADLASNLKISTRSAYDLDRRPPHPNRSSKLYKKIFDFLEIDAQDRLVIQNEMLSFLQFKKTLNPHFLHQDLFDALFPFADYGLCKFFKMIDDDSIFRLKEKQLLLCLLCSVDKNIFEKINSKDSIKYLTLQLSKIEYPKLFGPGITSEHSKVYDYEINFSENSYSTMNQVLNSVSLRSQLNIHVKNHLEEINLQEDGTLVIKVSDISETYAFKRFDDKCQLHSKSGDIYNQDKDTDLEKIISALKSNPQLTNSIKSILEFDSRLVVKVGKMYHDLAETKELLPVVESLISSYRKSTSK
ncbi:MAG: hypothetical protein AB8G05_04150 [Oligoflexales bacterium]